MYHANVPVKDRYSVYKDGIQCATLIYGAVVIKIDGKRAMRYDNYAPNESTPAFLNLLRTWGEAGVVKMRTKNTTKLTYKGLTCLMVIYNVNFGASMYLMWNTTTNMIHNSRDVIWLKRMYYPRTRNAPLIDEPNFCDVEVWEGIGVINTKPTANDTQDYENASEDE